MTYIENILACLSVPLLLAILFVPKKQRGFLIFLLLGMVTCLLSAYVNSFFMGFYETNATLASIEIAPVCEEVMKLLPLLFFLFVFEPDRDGIMSAAVALSTGFATFENVCYLTENGAADFGFLLIRGISAGALHILCGITLGYGLSYVFRHRWLTVTGTLGLVGCCCCLHGLYNLLSASYDLWQWVGYLFPSVIILVIYVLKKVLPRPQPEFS